MYNRADVIDQNFTRLIKSGNLPLSKIKVSLQQAGLTGTELLDLFSSQATSRHFDFAAQLLKNEGKCFYTIGSAGHEGNAAFGKAFLYTDMAFLHYRSCALMIQRSKQLEDSTHLLDLMLSFVSSSADPISGGRHKVLGSKPLFIPPQTSTIASHLSKAVGMAYAIKRARDLAVQGAVPENSVVLCSFGDASINHASAQAAFNAAAWIAYQNIPLPLVFICEDNGIGISTSTPNHWIENNFSQKPALHYIQCDGLNLLDTFVKAKDAERISRVRHQPVFLHMKTIRLMGHASSDIERSYLQQEEIQKAELNDPLLHTARIIIENGVASGSELIQIYENIRAEVKHIASLALAKPALENQSAVSESLTACIPKRNGPPLSEESLREALFATDYKKLNQVFHMAKLINFCLQDILLQYKNTLLFGEDVAEKGGVFNVTEGLHKKFGARRIFNTILDETTILGTAIGLAHNNFLPICEIQFLAYFHNAEDQIRGEAATLAFFSKGQFTNGLVVRIPGLAYQKGFGGHFHNDNSLAVFRDIPGLIVAVPSNGADAVTMLRTCVKEANENGRVCIFIEPIALYMTRDLCNEGDKLWASVYSQLEEMTPLGQFNLYGDGDDLLIMTYGNGYFYSRQAEVELSTVHKVKVKILDFRWLSPVDWEKVALVASRYKKILIVEECRKTGSFSEAIVTALAERLDRFPKIKIVSADDCFIPLGPASTLGLPKKKEIVEAALELIL